PGDEFLGETSAWRRGLTGRLLLFAWNEGLVAWFFRPAGPPTVTDRRRFCEELPPPATVSAIADAPLPAAGPGPSGRGPLRSPCPAASAASFSAPRVGPVPVPRPVVAARRSGRPAASPGPAGGAGRAPCRRGIPHPYPSRSRRGRRHRRRH